MNDALPAQEPILVEETVGRVRLMRLNRPDKKNALNVPLLEAIVRAVRAAMRDEAVNVVGIVGAGRTFSTGADLTDRSTSPDEAKARSLDDLGVVGRMVLALRVECDKPVIAGIEGLAIGAGLSLAMCADMRIASASARFHSGYARAGTSPDGGLSWTLPAIVGHERAMRFLLEQEMVTAEAAMRFGLVGEVVEDDRFEAAFLAYCARIAAVAPIAARQTKRLVTRACLPVDLAAHLREELHYAVRGLRSEDGREAVRAILEKRAPRFTGR